MDISLEEASRMCGVSAFSTLRRVVLPLLSPAILATAMLAFVRGMESFEGALILGAPAGLNTMATKIYEYLNWEPPDFPSAMAMGVTLLFIIVLLVLVQWRILGRRDFTTVSGKGYKPRPMNLGKWRWPLSALAILIVAMLTIPPMFILIQSTFMKSAGMYGEDMYTLKNYVTAFRNPHVFLALKNTIILGVVSATAGVLIYMLVSYVVVKTQFRERRTLDVISWIPWAVPPIVLALGLLWAYILLPLPFGITLYGTLFILIVALVARNFPVGTKIIGSTMIQISKELEEAAMASGASWIKTLFSIWIPILKSGIVTAWLLAYAFADRDLASVILLYNTDSRVLTTVFFDLWQQGELEAASVVGLLQGLLIIIAYVLIKFLARGGIKEMSAT
jgi:iron(III) transport system permease protein